MMAFLAVLSVVWVAGFLCLLWYENDIARDYLYRAERGRAMREGDE